MSFFLKTLRRILHSHEWLMLMDFVSLSLQILTLHSVDFHTCKSAKTKCLDVNIHTGCMCDLLSLSMPSLWASNDALDCRITASSCVLAPVNKCKKNRCYSYRVSSTTMLHI